LQGDSRRNEGKLALSKLLGLGGIGILGPTYVKKLGSSKVKKIHVNFNINVLDLVEFLP
jgi:hypothetical protein